MAKVKQTVKRRVKKSGGNSGKMRCNVCGGTGYQSTPYSKSKKK